MGTVGVLPAQAQGASKRVLIFVLLSYAFLVSLVRVRRWARLWADFAATNLMLSANSFQLTVGNYFFFFLIV